MKVYIWVLLTLAVCSKRPFSLNLYMQILIAPELHKIPFPLDYIRESAIGANNLYNLQNRSKRLKGLHCYLFVFCNLQ